MLADRIEGKWIDAFAEVFERCAVKRGDTAAILSETQSRQLNVQLAELALLRLGAKPFHIVLPTPRNRHPVPVRSTGASEAIGGLAPVIGALGAAGFVVDCTIEGLMHAPETPAILKAGARIMVISNEHPEALERMAPDDALEARVRAAAKLLRGSKRMTVTSPGGSNLDVDMTGAPTVGIWGWTEKPGTLAHWPGGIVVSFPKADSVNGTLVLDRGDVNLTFKRYLEAPVRLTLENDYVTKIEGEGDGRRAVPLVSGGVGRQERLRGVACRLRAESEGALRGADHVRPARHQRHRDPRGGGKFPVLHRRERIRRPLHGRALRPAGDAHHDHGGRDGGGEGWRGADLEHRRPVQPEVPEQLDERLQPLAPIRLDIEPS